MTQPEPAAFTATTQAFEATAKQQESQRAEKVIEERQKENSIQVMQPGTQGSSSNKKSLVGKQEPPALEQQPPQEEAKEEAEPQQQEGGEEGEEEKFAEMDDDSMIEHGKKMMALDRFSQAVAAFSHLLERKVARFEGDELNRELGDIWVLYGRSCYKNANSNVGVLQDEMLKQTTGGAPEQMLTPAGTKSSGGGLIQLGDDDEDDEGVWEDEEDGCGDEDDDENQITADDVLNDFQMAWEALETARLIFSKDPSSVLKLADVHLLLADMSLDEQRFDAAASDYKAALDLRKATLPPYDRRVSEAAYLLSSALEAEEKYVEALDALKCALEGLENRQGMLNKMLLQDAADPKTDAIPDDGKGKSSATNLSFDGISRSQAEEELEDLNSLIPEIKGRLDDVEKFVKAAAQEHSSTAALTSGISASSSSSTAVAPKQASSSVAADKGKVNDISGLVKKRKAPEPVADEVKRAKNDD